MRKTEVSHSSRPRLLVFCTVSTGLDAVAEVLRQGFSIKAIVGVAPHVANPETISGYVDISVFAKKWDIHFLHVESYNLNNESDKRQLYEIDVDLIWVVGWQRLIPEWLISKSKLGAIGGHGSPDGISGGRGRSPQNWALLLGCSQFDLALFRITEGVDEGPIIAQRTFFYRPDDDIQVSYYRATLAMADMVCEILANPTRLEKVDHQPTQAFYYPQRRPEDGMADWYQPADVVARHCRALTTPYPGLRTIAGDVTLTITRCQPFDDQLDGPPGEISHCFHSGDFLVNVLDGRLLVRGWTSNDSAWRPRPMLRLESLPLQQQLRTIVNRHTSKYPDQPISSRILRQLKESNSIR